MEASHLKFRRRANRKQTAVHCGVTTTTIRNWEKTNPLWPKPYKPSEQLVLYDLDEVDEAFEKMRMK
ncbi:hypothetical protein [Microbulbifer sp. ALW1]|uniref:hypothetical protein n=1 Tax=Microbulbifer sp. (strain ALW1) TaxID=1516059 RepID=UPI0013574CF4|nr:hypothetical protein [Microbulbifer sp. ALW1]